MQVWPSEWEGLSEAAMLALPPREQIWEIAYDLLPALHGRGLGTGMITAVMESWTRWLGIGTVIAVRILPNSLMSRC
jgi:RimJ/RimL family protein N-acetyltransferase